MTDSVLGTRQAVVAFLREEAPWELERLRSIAELDRDRPEVVGDRSDPVPLSHPRWFRSSLRLLAG